MATGAIGALVGALAAVPVLRAIFFPVGRKVVTGSGEPIDAIGADELEVGAPPRRVDIISDQARDAWARGESTRLGAAWLTKGADGTVTALSGVCPHLGCSIDFDGKQFLCPCHKSVFAATGERLTGPSKRGMDPLPVAVEGGRVKITWKRYKGDTAERVEV